MYAGFDVGRRIRDCYYLHNQGSAGPWGAARIAHLQGKVKCCTRAGVRSMSPRSGIFRVPQELVHAFDESHPEHGGAKLGYGKELNVMELRITALNGVERQTMAVHILGCLGFRW